MSAPDFRDVSALYATARAAQVSDVPWLDAGQVLDALDRAARTTDAAEAVAAADVLRTGIRRFLGHGYWLRSDAELVADLWEQGGAS